MSEEKKKKTKKKKEEVMENSVVSDSPIVEENISDIIEETMNEELKEVVEETVKEVVEDERFTSEEKLYITKLIANGYRPFDIVKKARFNLKLTPKKMERLSLNIRTVEQLVYALEN